MARGDFKQRITLELEDQASPGVDKVQSRFKELGGFLASKFVITLGDVVDLFKAIATAAINVVGAAQVQQDAVNKLDQALSSLGPTASRVSQALQQQAAALELTTKFSDEAIISNQALALNLGVSARDMEKLTIAAVELSAATGTSLESSFVNLSKTLNGVRGELGEVIPGMADLTEEALRSGAALDIVLDRLGGTAAAQVETFSGAITQLGNAWGSVKEKLGEAITENEAITESITRLKDVITSKEFLDAVVSVADGLANIVTASLNFITYVREASDVAYNFGVQLGEVGKRLKQDTENLVGYADQLTGGYISKIAEAGDTLLRLTGATREFDTATGAAADSTENLAKETAKSTAGAPKYTAAQADAKAAIEERTVAEIRATEAAIAFKLVQGDSSESAIIYRDAERELRTETDQLTISLERAAEAAGKVNQATGGSLTARDRRSQADVDAALAIGRVPNRNGTSIKTADGYGSRLLR